MTEWILVRQQSVGDGEIYPLKNGLNTIGRSKSNDVVTRSKYCSNNHCNIRVTSSGIELDDMSAHGTYLTERDSHLQKSTAKIFDQDFIGVGCSVKSRAIAAFNTDCFVFQLRLKPATRDICLDEDSTDIEEQPTGNQSLSMPTFTQGQNQFSPSIYQRSTSYVSIKSSDDDGKPLSDLSSDSGCLSRTASPLVRPINAFSTKSMPLVNEVERNKRQRFGDSPFEQPKKIKTDPFLLSTPRSPSPTSQEPSFHASHLQESHVRVQRTYGPEPASPPRQISAFQADHSHVFLSKITQWSASWLKNTNSNEYPPAVTASTGVYEDEVLKQIKVAIWKRIKRPNSTWYNVNIYEFSEESRGESRTILYRCEVIGPHPRVTKYDLLVIEIKGFWFFAYASNDLVKRNSDSVVIFDFETAWKMPPKYKGSARMQRITNIELEVNTARAIAHAKALPIYKVISNPLAFNKLDLPAAKDLKTFKLLTVQQNEALKKAYTLCENSLQPILIIDGCPGSGKTTILLELVYKLAVVLQKRVLVCSGNSTTTDTHASSLDRMSNASMNVIRYGTNTKLNIHHYISPQMIAKRSATNAKDGALIYNEAVNNANVICITLDKFGIVKLYNKLARQNDTNAQMFDVCIIDDAAQGCELVQLLPFLFSINTVIMFGDRRQAAVAEPKYSVKSLFGRLTDTNPALVSFTLNEQHRMPYGALEQIDQLFSYGMTRAHNQDNTKFPIIDYAVINCQDTEEMVVNLLEVIIETINIGTFKTVIIASDDTEKLTIENALRSRTPNIFEKNRIRVLPAEDVYGRDFDVVLIINPMDMKQYEHCIMAMTRAKKSLFICENFQRINAINPPVNATFQHIWLQIIQNAILKNRYLDARPNNNNYVDLKSFITSADNPPTQDFQYLEVKSYCDN